MHSIINPSTILALLSCASSIYGHGIIVDAYGSANHGARGRGVGYVDQYDSKRNYGTGQHPQQLDVPVFKDPIIPCCNKPRKYLVNGCGITLFEVWRHTLRGTKYDTMSWYDYQVQKVLDLHSPKGYQLNMAYEMGLLTSAKLIPQSKQGGTLHLLLHQVNADGGGPYNCKLDTTGMANSWVPLTVTKNVPGDQYSINIHGVLKRHWMDIQLPAKFTCTGRWGNYNNICMVRCENQAVNGPFGGCVPFQQVDVPQEPEYDAYKPVKPVKPVQPAKPYYPPQVHHKREKRTAEKSVPGGRPPTDKELEGALGGESFPKEVKAKLKEEVKITPGEAAKLREAEEENEAAVEDAVTTDKE